MDGLHRLAERRSLEYHRRVAALLAADPGILEEARRRVLAWIRIGGRASPYALRWREILDGPPDAIARILTDEGEDATALRQSTPFAGALDARERWKIWRDERRSWDGDR